MKQNKIHPEKAKKAQPALKNQKSSDPDYEESFNENGKEKGDGEVEPDSLQPDQSSDPDYEESFNDKK